MAKTTRQTAIFGVEDWKRLYQTYREANFQSYDFETLRKSFVDYLRLYYPETFNDYIESSEFIALLDVMAFMGQALAFRTDLNTRENYLDTAERRDSVERLANLVSYTPKRNVAANGYLKVESVRTTENVYDLNGVNLSNVTVNWADPTNINWQEQFTAIVNSSLVNTQRIGRPAARQEILGVNTDVYSVNLIPGYLPILSFAATVDNITMPFEAVSATFEGRDYVYEVSPRPNQSFNILFRNDQLGFNSPNTGFFFYFKQGTLQNLNFNLAERIPNRTVDVNIEGVNNDDRWLYKIDNVGSVREEWKYVESVYTSAAEQVGTTPRPIYSTSSRANDQITLNFGDGVFSAIPVGLFRIYARASNGLKYTINPADMQSITLPISYTSRSGQLETITFTCSLSQPVTNAEPREAMAEIKQRAPARYYTQNRMVNGEDYNNFPFTAYNNILKSKALNRASIGTSRYLDLLDATNKYSSTNVFGSDGALYEEDSLPTFLFTWLTTNEINEIIGGKIETTLSATPMQQFYYANFSRPSLTSLNETWNQSTSLANETTGFFQNSAEVPQPIGPYTSNNNKYIIIGSLVKFVPPAGYFFDANNRLKPGTPVRPEEKLVIWASPTAVYIDGTNQGLGNFPDGTGPVVLNNFVPTGAIATEVVPIFKSALSTSLKQNIIEQIQLFRNFGLGYNNLTGTWYLITSTNLAVNAPFSEANAESTSGINDDASWLIQVLNDGETFTVTSRALNYFFASELQIRFFFYGDEKIYDVRSGSTIRDFVNVLKTNSQPDSSLPLASDIYMNIVGQPVLSDGYVDDFQVLVSSRDSDDDGVPDNPDFFNDIVAPTVNSNSKLVFLRETIDFDDLQRYLLVERGLVNSEYATKTDIQEVLLQYVPGQVFYAYTDNAFYVLVESTTGVRSLEVSTEYVARIGRQDLFFQYRHNTNLNNRIDPGSSNIIDVYLVPQQYYTAYQNYIKDITGTIPEPDQPTIEELSVAYQGLQNYKMISDNMVLNSVTFKPLFGPKAAANLQATIKVIRASGSTASVSEIKNLVLATIEDYFTLDKWDFGDTFYFSELAAYIHKEIGDVVSSVVLVPLNPEKSFGDLYEIRSAPNEIFVNAALVSSIQVIEALTSTNLRTAPGSGVI